jgi:hypothetical protein
MELWKLSTIGKRLLWAFLLLLCLLVGSEASAQNTSVRPGSGGGGGGGDVNITAVGGNAVTTTLPVSGNITCSNCSGSGVSVLEDAAFANAAAGTPAYAVRQSSPANTSDANGDWEPLQINGGRLWVDASGTTLTVASHAVTNAGTFVVQENGAALTALQLLDNLVLAEDAVHSDAAPGAAVFGVRRDTVPSSSASTAGDYALFNVDANGRLYVNAVLYNGSGTEQTLGQDRTEDTTEAGGENGPLVLSVRRNTLAASTATTGEYATFNTNEFGALWTAPTATTNGGADGFRYSSAGATEDEHAVKASAGTLYSITATNTNAEERYLRCNTNVIASTTPGTDTPEIDLAIPGQTTGSGITFSFPVGYSFSTGLTCWLVTGAADTDVTEVAANEIKLFYSVK